MTETIAGMDAAQVEMAITAALTLAGTHVLRKVYGEKIERPETQRLLHFWGSGAIALVAGLATDAMLGQFSLAGGVGKALLAWFAAQGIRRFKKGAGIA